MKRIALLGVLLALFVSGCVEQKPESKYWDPEPLYELYKPLVVQIQTRFVKGNPEHGFGFIVGEDAAAKQFYIVTANHVVRNENPDDSGAQISVRLSWDSGTPRIATLLDNYSGKNELDLALLRLDKKVSDQNPWKEQTWCRDWQKRQSVWFIGWEDKFQFPPEPGILLERTPAPARIKIWMETIKPGNSGTPLIIEDGGIVGMAVKDNSVENKVVAVDIEDIYNFVHVQNSYNWKLNKGNCAGSGSGHIKIIHHKSNEDAAQRIVTALQGAGFTTEMLLYFQWVTPMRDNFARLGEMIPDYGGYKLFYSENQKPLADKARHVVNQLLKDDKLETMLVDSRILKALEAETNGMLIVLNNN